MGRLGSIARGVVETLVGLIVDDGLVVVGALLALVVTGLLANLAPAIPHWLFGLLLFLLVAATLMGSLLRAARRARRPGVGTEG